MNIIRLLKIVTALCVCTICFVFIPNIVGPEYSVLQMGFYAVFSVILIFIFYKLFGEILNKDRSSLPVYDYSKEQSPAILISPVRVIFLSLVMILFSCAVITFLFFCGLFQPFKLTLPESYPPLITCLAFVFVFFKGIGLWIRRNEVVQLKFTSVDFHYMPVDIKGVGRGRGFSILTMYFRTKMVSLSYANINAISIDKNAWRGDMIRITTIANRVIHLPFLPNDMNQLEAVYDTFVERWNQSKRSADNTRF